MNQIMTQPIIEISDVHKRYYLGKNRPHSLKAAVFSRFDFLFNRRPYWALQGVTLQILPGRAIGLIGNNGAGKSTLLRLIAKLSLPTSGKITFAGKVHLGSLLELGAGFNPEFSGRDNIITACIVAGLTRKEALARLDRVIKFAELEDFIDSQLRTYSTGMYVRLAFSIEINLDPDILLIDEVLAVGDIAFQKKCISQLQKMKELGTTLIVVSHSMEQILGVCDEVIWLEHGKVRAHGETTEIINLYRNRIFENTARIVEATKSQPIVASSVTTPAAVAATTNSNTRLVESPVAPSGPRLDFRTGTQEIEITGASLFDEHGLPVNLINSRGALILQISYIAHVPLINPIVQVGLHTEDGLKCYEITNQEAGINLGSVEGAGQLNVGFGELPLFAGTYYFSIGVHEQNWNYIYDYKYRICRLEIEGSTPGTGVFYPVHRWYS